MDLRDIEMIQISVDSGVNRADLLFERDRRIDILLQQFDHPLPSLELGTGVLVEVGSELRECFKLTVLRKRKLQASRYLLHGFRLSRSSDSGDRESYVDRRLHSRIEEPGLKENLSIRNGDDVRRDVGGYVSCLGLDDRQCGDGPGPEGIIELRGSLEQSGVQIEDISGVCLSSRGASQQERHLTVGIRMLREVVVDDEYVFALEHEVFPHGDSCEWSKPLHSGGCRGSGGDDDRVFHRSGFLELFGDRDDLRILLSDCDVDAFHIFSSLIQDRVDGDLSLSGLPISDDELPLPSSDRHKRIKRLDSGLERLMHRFPAHDSGCDPFRRVVLLRFDLPESVDRVSQSVDHSSEESLSDRYFKHFPGFFGNHPFFDCGESGEDDDSDEALFKIQCDSHRSGLEFHKLIIRDVPQSHDFRDTVSQVDHLSRVDPFGAQISRIKPSFDLFYDSIQYIRICHEIY